jgi:hypothetical protein
MHSKFPEKTKVPNILVLTHSFCFFRKLLNALKTNNDPEKFSVLCAFVVNFYLVAAKAPLRTLR